LANNNSTLGSGKGATGWLVLSVIIIALDQASKWAIVKWVELYQSIPVTEFLDITYLQNTGAAFSFLADASGWQRWFFISLGIVVSVVIVFWLRQLKAGEQKVLVLGLSLLVGGALGNVIDRVHHGFVVDFIHVHWQAAYFPAFNVADSAITVGAICLIIDALFLSGRARDDEGGGRD
jgi:signal peptidase II